MASDTMLIRAKQLRIGDVVTFANILHDFTVEAIEYTRIGLICFQHHDHTGSSCYKPDEVVYIKRRQR